MNLLQPERLQALARDYALGTMTGGARRRFARLLRQSAAAEQAVLAWQQRLSTLAASVPPLQPSDRVWQGLEQRLFKPAAKPVPAVSRLAWLQNLVSGRTLGGALAGMLLAVVVLREQPSWLGLEPASETLPASYVGLLHDALGKPTLLASSRRHGKTLTVKMLQPLPVPQGQQAVLWALPKDGGKPFVVGTVPGNGSATLPLTDSAEKIFFSVSRLGVSFEASARPESPGGEFVLKGDCVKLW
jgi:anti-sigma-K factor RskA